MRDATPVVSNDQQHRVGEHELGTSVALFCDTK